jgi:hypothetical protein
MTTDIEDRNLVAQLSKASPGSIILDNTNDPWTKQGDGEWLWAYGDLRHGTEYLVRVFGPITPKYVFGPVPQEPERIFVLDTEGLDALPLGTIIKLFTYAGNDTQDLRVKVITGPSGRTDEKVTWYRIYGGFQLTRNLIEQGFFAEVLYLPEEVPA